MEEFEMIAKTFEGLEEVLAKELTQLGANEIEIGRRMVAFKGNKELMYRANFALRTAIRILKPIKHFKAKSADDVYEAVKAIEWTDYLDNKTTFAIDAVVFSEEFRHSKFVAYKVKDAIADYFREKTGDRPNVRLSNPDIQLNIHVAEDKCTLSLDSSGESLHRRGYRQEAVEAPLNEVLAAGMLMMAGWDGSTDFIDPMCGSGTLPIEAALMACNIAPGVFRKEFAFEKWPDFDKDLFESIYNDDSQEREFNHHIYGYDIKNQAVEIATRNVKAAGVAKYVTIQQADVADFEEPAEKALMVTNPPYGERISSPDLLGLYKTIGERLKHAFKGNDAWILSYRKECFDEIGLKPSTRIPLFNGPLECEFRKYQLFDGKMNNFRGEGGDIKTAEERKHNKERKFRSNREFNRRSDEEENDETEGFHGHHLRSRDDERPRKLRYNKEDGERRGGFRSGSRDRKFSKDRDDHKDSRERGDRKDFRRGDRKEKSDFKRGGDFKKGGFRKEGSHRDGFKKGGFGRKRDFKKDED